ncbi:uncharacterized protein LOC128993941 isoform X4 [Macrosteles quadrilineatus]|uniref:uncharacterized protein LOC128993941 isoform X4 n=1 Tax=Macrosteles quadrilineatus TaxID=74068 RepID=UPI0023E0F40E|nr:uncharacterized protein LOC128993941 isoform X4 [Macrosteles quadrilineatus]
MQDRSSEWVAPVEDTSNVDKQTMAMVTQPQTSRGYQMPLKSGVLLKRRIVRVTLPGVGMGSSIEDGHGPFLGLKKGNLPNPEQIQGIIRGLKEKMWLIQEELHGGPVGQLGHYDSNINMLKALGPGQTKMSQNQTKPLEGGQTDVGHPMMEIDCEYERIHRIYKLTSQLPEQSSIIVEGSMNDNAKWFEVTFLVGEIKEDCYYDLDKYPEIALLFHPMTGSTRINIYTYRNYRSKYMKYDGWGYSKGSVDEKFPFRPGQPFYIEFYITKDQFQVAVDGQHYISYSHQLSFKDINRIQVRGHITLANVDFQNTPKYPSPLPQTKPAEEWQTDFLHPMLEIDRVLQRMYVVYKLTSQLYEQSSIIAEGFVNEDARWFEVNFLVGSKDDDDWHYFDRVSHEKPDNAFQFRPLFTSKIYTYRNYWTAYKGWGYSEGSESEQFPFRRGQPFYIEFYITKAEFKVAVDGQHYVTYTHRLSLKDINRIQFLGHITLTNVHFQNTPKYPSPLSKIKPVEGEQTDTGTSMLEIDREFETIHRIYKLTSQPYVQSSLIVKGSLDDNSTWFEVNFLTGNKEDYDSPDIVFQFNPIIGKKHIYTYRNTCMNGKWGDVEGSVAEWFPFRRGQPFYLEFYITKAEFMVAVDGRHYVSYKHRVPFRGVTRIQFRGHITLTNVHFQNTPKYPSPLPKIKPAEGGQTVVGHPKLKIDRVFETTHMVYKLRTQLYEQSSIIADGFVDEDAKWFEVNFLVGYKDDDDWSQIEKPRILKKEDDGRPDIAFQFNPRFAENINTYRNTYINGTWGVKEGSIAERFPFRRGQPFFLEFYITKAEFMVAVDGRHFISYKHREPFRSVTRIQFRGDITLANVDFQDTPKYPSPQPQGVWIPAEDYNEEEHGVQITTSQTENQKP